MPANTTRTSSSGRSDCITQVDRRYIQAVIAAWIILYLLLLRQILSMELHRGDSVTLEVFGALFLIPGSAIVAAVCFGIPLRIILNLAIKERRWSHREETICGLILLFAMIGYFAESQRELRSLAPPEGVTTFVAFSRVMPPPRRLRLIEREGATTLRGPDN